MNIISGVGNTVAKMADAMDTTDACTLAIEVKHGPKSLINIISTFEMKMTLSEVVSEVVFYMNSVYVLLLNRLVCYIAVPRLNLLTVLRWDISYCRTLLKHKFHLEHCNIKADFTLNVLLVHISVL